MADTSLAAQFQDGLSLNDNTLNKKRSQRFTVQRSSPAPAAPPPMPPYPMQQDYHHPHQQMMDRTLSSDSSESLPYGYPQQPLWFNPVISRPDMSAFPPPQTMPPPPPGMDPYAPLALLPGQEEVTDEIIPTAIVIKNIPFSVPREQVMSIMDSLQLVAPYAFNYHYDVGPNSASTFRGLAFANFRDPAETTAALAALNGYEIQGRRLRVEYKRVLRHGEKEKIEREKALKRMRSAVSMNGSGLPGGYSGHEDDFMHAMANQPPPVMSAYDSHVWASHPPAPTYQQPPPPAPIHSYAQQAPLSMGSPGSSDLGSGADPSSSSQSSSAQAAGSPIKADLDMNDPQTLEIYSRVLLFKDDSLRDELAFARSLSGHQRRTVHLVAQRLGLDHKSVGEADSRHVVVFKGGDSDGQRTMNRMASASNLRTKKSEPTLRTSTPTTPNVASRKSNTDLRAASRRDRPTVQGVFQHPSGPVPPMPALRTAASFDVIDASTSPISVSPTNGLFGASSSSPLRQPRGPSDRTGLAPGRSNAAGNWRLNSTSVPSLDEP